METIDDIVTLIRNQGDDWLQHKNATNDELAGLRKDFDKFFLASQRPGSTWNNATTGTGMPPSKTLTNAVRALLAGDQNKANTLFGEAKAMSAGSGPDGGYVVLPKFSSETTRVAGEISPVSRLARTVTLDSGLSFEEIVDRDQAGALWVAETSARGDTTAPALAKLSIECAELCAQPKASQSLLDGASIDVVAWLQEKVAEAFAVAEGHAFLNGNGVGKPRGLLTYTTVATPDATRAWGTLQHVATGSAGAFPVASTSVNSADPLVDLVGALKTQYRVGASWLMNRTTAATVRKLKDADGRHIWTDSLLVGQPAVLLGYPVVLDESMPDVAANSLSIAFGNIQKGYTIVRRLGTRFLVDPYTDKPNVRLYAFARVGAAVNNFEAIKLLKFAAT